MLKNYEIKEVRRSWNIQKIFCKFITYTKAIRFIKKVYCRCYEAMRQSNGLSVEDQFSNRLASKIEAYTTARQSSDVLLFFLFFVDMMFFGAADVSIYFKIQSELKEETHTVLKLYRIGITDKELWKILRRKNSCYYMLPLMFGILSGVYYSYCVNALYGYGTIGFICGSLVAVITFVIQIFVIWLTTKNEYKSINLF